MSSYPGPKVHRPSRRKLGRGQYTQQPAVDVEITGSGSVATLTFSSPVVVNGDIPLSVDTRTFVSQEVTSSTTVEITVSGAVTGLDYDLPANLPQIKTFQGGTNNGVSGTFA